MLIEELIVILTISLLLGVSVILAGGFLVDHLGAYGLEAKSSTEFSGGRMLGLILFKIISFL